MSKQSSGGSTIGFFGFWIAGILSYLKWSRFWLAFGHALLGWIYVIYYVLKYGLPVVSR